MIQKMTHATLYVLDQDQAKDFYVDKLGLNSRLISRRPMASDGSRSLRKDSLRWRLRC